MHIGGVSLFLLGILCLAGAIVSLVFMIIGFAGNKRGKFAWLAGMLMSVIALGACVSLLTQKVSQKIEDMNTMMVNGMEVAVDSISGSAEDNRTYVLDSSKQTSLLKSYVKDTAVNPQFYTYFGFRDYFRFPLRYPYAIHCIDTKDNGYLFNEKNVKKFDQSDNGDIDLGIPGIKRIAFDKRFLLVEQQNEVTGTADSRPNELKYLLFEFDTEQVLKPENLSQLFDMAHRKGYAGPDSLITIEAYDKLF